MTKSPDEKKRPVGRPSKYKPEYCQKMIEFFDIDPINYVTETLYDKDGNPREVKKESKVGPVFPSFTRFAHNIGVCDNTLLDWSTKHDDFMAAYSKCEKLQEEVWRINALRGSYNSQFSIFLGKNVYGYRDKNEIEQTVNVTQMPTIKLSDGSDLDFDVGEDPE